MYVCQLLSSCFAARGVAVWLKKKKTRSLAASAQCHTQSTTDRLTSRVGIDDMFFIQKAVYTGTQKGMSLLGLLC